MTNRKKLWKNATRAAAGVNLLWNFASVPRPPSPNPAARTQEMQTQWAKNEEINVLLSRRRNATQLGYQLREPDSAEYRAREDNPRQSTEKVPARQGHAKDAHDRTLAEVPQRTKERGGRRRGGKER